MSLSFGCLKNIDFFSFHQFLIGKAHNAVFPYRIPPVIGFRAEVKVASTGWTGIEEQALPDLSELLLSDHMVEWIVLRVEESILAVTGMLAFLFARRTFQNEVVPEVIRVWAVPPAATEKFLIFFYGYGIFVSPFVSSWRGDGREFCNPLSAFRVPDVTERVGLAVGEIDSYGAQSPSAKFGQEFPFLFQAQIRFDLETALFRIEFGDVDVRTILW